MKVRGSRPAACAAYAAARIGSWDARVFVSFCGLSLLCVWLAPQAVAGPASSNPALSRSSSTTMQRSLSLTRAGSTSSGPAGTGPDRPVDDDAPRPTLQTLLTPLVREAITPPPAAEGSAEVTAFAGGMRAALFAHVQQQISKAAVPRQAETQWSERLHLATPEAAAVEAPSVHVAMWLTDVLVEVRACWLACGGCLRRCG